MLKLVLGNGSGILSEGPKGGRRKGGRGRKLSHFSFCCAFRCCVVYSPCFPVWGEEKVMTIYDAGPLATGPLCGLLILFREYRFGEENSLSLTEFWGKLGEFFEKLGEFVLAHK